MKVRRQKDIEILNNADFGSDDFCDWVKELFLGEDTEKFRIPEDVFDFGFEVMRKNYLAAKNGEIRKLILRKILHTREVVEAGCEILEREDVEEWNPYMAGTVTFLHDMGRFPQAHFGDYSDVRTGFDHAKAGAEMILIADFPKSSERGIDMERVADAVRQHSNLFYVGSDIYGKFARDADKMGLINYFHYHIVDFPIKEDKVNSGALETFLAGKMVLKADMQSKIDVFLCWLSWQCDFNFGATKELFVGGGMKEYILGEIRRMDGGVWEKVADLG